MFVGSRAVGPFGVGEGAADGEDQGWQRFWTEVLRRSRARLCCRNHHVVLAPSGHAASLAVSPRWCHCERDLDRGPGAQEFQQQFHRSRDMPRGARMTLLHCLVLRTAHKMSRSNLASSCCLKTLRLRVIAKLSESSSSASRYVSPFCVLQSLQPLVKQTTPTPLVAFS